MKKILKSLYNRDQLVLIILVGLFLLIRLAVLLSSLDKLSDLEELYHGTIAHEIITGPVMSLWEYLDYKVEYFPGGSLTAGILAVPFFLIFGHTYTALKLVGLSFALGTFILWFIFLKDFFNKRTACLAGLLFIFCVPFYAKTSLITWGSHPEANFFTILAILLFYRIFFKPGAQKAEGLSGIYRAKSHLFFFLGLVLGFGVWFVQSYLLTVIFIFLCWFIFDKGIFIKKPFFILSAGFLTGFSPALYYAFFFKAAVLDVNGRLFLSDFIFTPYYFLAKAAVTVFKSLPQSFLFSGSKSIPANVYSYLFYCIFIAAFIRLLWVNRKSLRLVFGSLAYPVTLRGKAVMPEYISRDVPLLIFPVLFLIGYSFSKYTVNPPPADNPDAWFDFIAYRYMAPVIPFILVILAVFLGRVKNALAAALFFVLLALGVIGNLSMVSFNSFGRFLSDKGYSYRVLSDKIAFRGKDNFKEYIKPFLKKLQGGELAEFYEGIGSGMAWRFNNKEPQEIILAFEKEIGSEYQPQLYKGWGSLFSLEIPEEFEKAMFVVGFVKQEYKKNLYQGFGVGVSFKDISEAAKIIERISPGYRQYCYIGLGEQLGCGYKNDPAGLNKILRDIYSQYRQYVLEGIEQGKRER